MAVPPLKKRLFAALLLILTGSHFCAVCFSQDLVKSSKNEELFQVRTKQFNEFIARFNYKTDFKGDPIDSAFKSKFPRERMVNSLFDLKDPRVIQTGNTYSKKYVASKSEFISEVIGKNLLIYKYSENIIAGAKSRVLLNGIPKIITIFMSQEIVGKDMVKWVICGVKGEMFSVLKTDTTFIRFIPPSSNETDFMNLKRALEDTDYLQYYAYKEYSPDYLPLFFYLLKTGSVKFDYVEEITYHIIDIPGWCITVKEFNRNEMNSGWLISDVQRNDLDKADYLKSLK
jgi:hypothetical protein